MTTLPIIPTFNNAVGCNPYVSAAVPWPAALNDTARKKSSVPRFAEWVKHFGRCLIRHGLYMTTPMPVNQQELVLAALAANPDDPDIQAQADISAFIEGCAELAGQGITIAQYVGAPWRYERQGSEPITRWTYRLRQELAPQLAHCDTIMFDNTMGSSATAYGEWTSAAVLHFIGGLLHDGYKVVGEPTWWEHSAPRDVGAFLSTAFYANQERRDPDATTTWQARGPVGNFTGDPSPLLVPGMRHEPVYIWLDFRATPAYDGDPKTDRLGYIHTIHRRWPHAWLCCPFGWLPTELLDA